MAKYSTARAKCHSKAVFIGFKVHVAIRCWWREKSEINEQITYLPIRIQSDVWDSNSKRSDGTLLGAVRCKAGNKSLSSDIDFNPISPAPR